MIKNRKIRKKLIFLIGISIISTLLACTFEMDIIEGSQTRNPKFTDSIPVLTQVSVSGTKTPVVENPLHSDPEADCQEATLAGLIFGYPDQDNRSLWQVGTCGNLLQLSTHSNIQVSPGGDQALYTNNGDIWIVNFLDGSERNLTSTPDRIEAHPHWWQGQDDLIVFGSWSASENLGPTSGYLSLISKDGSNYRVLTDRASNAAPAPQPNGTMVAYDLGDSAWLYHIDKDESELFDISIFDLQIRQGMKIGSPSWSPDGSKLAWWIGGVFSPPLGGSVALAVFNLGTGRVEVLHPYTPIGSGGWFPPAIWSPEGDWLAAVTLGEAHKTDLWVMRADGGEEHNLGFASDPVWYPEGGWLIFHSLSDERLKRVETSSWNLQTIDLPPGSTPLGWQGIIPDISTASQQSAEEEPYFGPDVQFTTNPEEVNSQSVFPYGTPEVFGVLSYHNMRDGLTVRGEWSLDGGVLMAQEEIWDSAQYGSDGLFTKFSIYDFERSLEPGRYQFRLYIEGREQPLGQSEAYSAAFFDIAAPLGISPQVSPDLSRTAIVEPPGTLIIQDAASQDQLSIFNVAEISSLVWYPDGKFILYSIRDRSIQQSAYESIGYVDQLWVVNLETGESYPWEDQYGQATGFNLHDPSISPDGRYLAVIEGSGWVDACQVARKLWVKEIKISGNRLNEVFSYYQLDFDIVPYLEAGEMYIERIIGWDSPTLLKVELRWACTGENHGGIYRLDMSTLTAEELRETE